MVDLEFLRLYALRTGLGLKYLSKDEKISAALEQLGPLFPEAIFKGGTALNRLHLARMGKNRFSEDIDLDYIAEGRFEDNKDTVARRMQRLTGFEVAAPRRMNWTLRFDCGYTNEWGERDLIRVEFQLRGRRALPSEDTIVKSPFIEAHTTVFRVYTLEGLIAMKLMALYNRTEGKDIYDIYYALDLPFDDGELRSALQTSIIDNGIEPGSFKEDLMEKLKEAKKRSFFIGNSTNHFITRSLRPNWKIFIQDLMQKLDRRL